jgi:hypothetical protein
VAEPLRIYWEKEKKGIEAVQRVNKIRLNSFFMSHQDKKEIREVPDHRPLTIDPVAAHSFFPKPGKTCRSL